jgi:hypothetical protein
VTQALQTLAKSQLRDVEFYSCNELALGSVCGFLLKRLSHLNSFSVCASSSLPNSVASAAASCERLTRVSFQGCVSINESHLVPLAGGAHHIRHLNLSETGMEARKLFKFAEALAKQDRATIALETLDLSGLTELSLSSVVAVMKAGSPSLKHLLLERSKVELAVEKDQDRKAALKKKAKNKRVGSGKKGGGGPKSGNKDKKSKIDGKKEEEEKEGGEVKKEDLAEQKQKKPSWQDDSIKLEKLRTSISRLTLSESVMSDWVGAQIVKNKSSFVSFFMNVIIRLRIVLIWRCWSAASVRDGIRKPAFRAKPALASTLCCVARRTW